MLRFPNNRTYHPNIFVYCGSDDPKNVLVARLYKTSQVFGEQAAKPANRPVFF